MTYLTLGIIIGACLMGLFTVAVHAADPVKPKRIENRMSLKAAQTVETTGQGANRIEVRIKPDVRGDAKRELVKGKADSMDRGELVQKKVKNSKVIRPKVKRADEPLTVEIAPKGKRKVK